MERDYTKIDSSDAPWLTSASARAVCDAIALGGHQIYYVGGCVRNALLGAPVSDVDMATSAAPKEVISLVQKAGLKAVPTGLEHGTITVLSSNESYEVTTFRRDVETNGRHAIVRFSNDIRDDARRRDFTMNALYADVDGTVIDPLSGVDDLRAGRVRFIEDAAQRIKEDYLRTLRYFRFHAWYGNTVEGLDPEALAAIAENLDGLETLSAERIGNEVSKLLRARDPSTSLAAMRQTGVLGSVLPGADTRFLMIMIHGEQVAEIEPDWLGRLAALGGDGVPDRLRLSKKEARKYVAIQSAAYGSSDLLETAYEDGAQISSQAYLIRCAIAERLPEAEYLSELSYAAVQTFPVSAQDLMPSYEGPRLGARLAYLKSVWIASKFTLGKDELVALPPY